jgi:hypothetical protein
VSLSEGRMDLIVSVRSLTSDEQSVTERNEDINGDYLSLLCFSVKTNMKWRAMQSTIQIQSAFVVFEHISISGRSHRWRR